jgi:hypothetical protein
VTTETPTYTAQQLEEASIGAQRIQLVLAFSTFIHNFSEEQRSQAVLAVASDPEQMELAQTQLGEVFKLIGVEWLPEDGFAGPSPLQPTLDHPSTGFYL